MASVELVELWKQNLLLIGSYGEEADRARQWVNENLQKNPVANLQAFLSITQDSEDDAMKRLGVTGLNNLLNYTNKATLQGIRSSWSPEISNAMRTLVINALLCPDEVLRKLIGRTFALLYGIEGARWNPLPELAATLNRFFSEQNAVPMMGLLSAFLEVLHLPNLDEHWREKAEMDKAIPICHLALRIITAPSVPIPLRNLAIVCLEVAFEKYPKIFELSSDDETGPFLAQILQSLQISIELMDPTIFLSCHRLMLNMVWSFYPLSDSFLEPLFHWTTGILSFSSPNYDEFKNISLFFWKLLSEREGKNQRRDPSKSKHIIGRAFESISGRLFEAMASAQSATEPIEPDNSDLVSTATLTLRAFFNTEPTVVFPIVKQNIEAMVSSGSWNAREGAILAMWALTSDEKEIPGASEDQEEFGCYIMDFVLPTLIRYAQNKDEAPRLKRRILLALTAVLQQYQTFISRPCVRRAASTEMIQQLLPLFEEDESDISLACLYGKLLCAAVAVWGKTGALTPYMRRIIHFAYHLYSRADQFSGDEQIRVMTESAEMINRVIRGLDSESLGLLQGLYMEKLRELEQSLKSIEPDNVRFVRQGTLCSILGSIILRWKQSEDPSNLVPGEIVNNTLEVLFTVLSCGGSMIASDVLYVMSGIVLHAYDVIAPGAVMTMYGFAMKSFSTESPDIISAACVLLGDLFRTRCEEMKEVFREVLDILCRFWGDHDRFYGVHCLIMKAMADMLTAMSEYVPEFDKEVVREAYSRVLVMAMSSKLQYSDSANIETANNYCEYLCLFMTAYIAVYLPVLRNVNVGEIEPGILAEERRVLNMVVDIAKRILSLEKPNHWVFYQFVGLADVVSHKCSRRNNVIANRPDIVAVLKKTEAFGAQPALVQKAKQVREALGKL